MNELDRLPVASAARDMASAAVRIASMAIPKANASEGGAVPCECGRE